MAMSRFYEIDPSLENLWRAIILFGRNVASYKFALAKALYDLKDCGKTILTLDELASPFASHICEHLKLNDKQGTSERSAFLAACRSFNENKIAHADLIRETVQHGFNNVIDAFHNVHGQEVAKRFFMDERKENNAIRLTDEFFLLGERAQYSNLPNETEARWRLVETAWKLNLPRNLVVIDYDANIQSLVAINNLRRTNVTAARSALNGYQKGRCFYCFRGISITSASSDVVDVSEIDHFFPHVLKRCDNNKPIDGVANLVLSCSDCNRGPSGKFERLPSISLLERLYMRNEYLIISHHPLRETLIGQTGNTAEKRQKYLQDAYNCASAYFGFSSKWEPKAQGATTF
jgi:hypothetical protein